MLLLMVEVDMRKITRYTLEEIPEEIDKIVEPYHMKWRMLNYYIAEAGYDEDESVWGAVNALYSTEWLKDGLYVSVARELVHRRLEMINTEGMTPPRPEKLEHYRNFFRDNKVLEYHLPNPNPIVIDSDNKIRDGYITYLIMQEKGLEDAMCILVNLESMLQKYVWGVHLLDEEGATSIKCYTWAYPLNEAVVPGDILLAGTKRGNKLIKVLGVDLGIPAHVESLEKIKRKATEKDFENKKYYGFT